MALISTIILYFPVVCMTVSDTRFMSTPHAKVWTRLMLYPLFDQLIIYQLLTFGKQTVSIFLPNIRPITSYSLKMRNNFKFNLDHSCFNR